VHKNSTQPILLRALQQRRASTGLNWRAQPNMHDICKTRFLLPSQREYPESVSLLLRSIESSLSVSTAAISSADDQDGEATLAKGDGTTGVLTQPCHRLVACR
jgi:hypothetical protein